MLATVVKPHGLAGEVWVDLNTDFPERLAERPELTLVGRGGARAVRIEHLHGLTGGRAIIKLSGVEDRKAAEAIRGARLEIEEAELPPPPEGEFYEFQIIGLRVVTTGGRDLGRVEQILRTGANDVYETAQALIPAIADVVLDINLERGEIVVAEIDGLLK